VVVQPAHAIRKAETHRRYYMYHYNVLYTWKEKKPWIFDAITAKALKIEEETLKTAV
jgi:hypothetical protein